MIGVLHLKNVMGAALMALISGASCASLSVKADESISLPGKMLFPEGIAVDDNGGLYVGSLTKGRILYLEPGNHNPQIFVADGSSGLMSVVGMLVSQDNETLFVCNSDIGVSPYSGASKPGLVAFNTKDGTYKDRWEFPGGGLCNDLTMTPNGAILVTDSSNPRILILKPGEQLLREWISDERFKGEGFNLNGITWSETGVYVIKFNSNEIFKITQNTDGSAGSIEKIALSRPLGGPDGLETLVSGKLLVVEGAGTLATIDVDGLSGNVTTISEGLNVPTTAAIFGNTAYVVEGQLDHLPFPDSKAGPPEPFTLQAIEINP